MEGLPTKEESAKAYDKTQQAKAYDKTQQAIRIADLFTHETMYSFNLKCALAEIDKNDLEILEKVITKIHETRKAKK